MGQKNVLARKINESPSKQAYHRDRDANITSREELPWSRGRRYGAVRLRDAIVAADAGT